ncbi:MAG: hypothetical protein KIT35_21875 [Piscinibacter sp.]|uniref:hypothetical protein n=1 Tax=Piscinibacter sp. TaxID=1903157 RepID=UPI002589F88C|nr:hypothetical protein [Piscinibacter sp.]MCW5666489.1 hypothetical protein [Piscinibacter sp.]
MKTLALGRAKNLRRLEVAGLQRVYGLRPQWLDLGEGEPIEKTSRLAIEWPPPRSLEAAEPLPADGPVAPLDVNLYSRVVESVLAEMERQGVKLGEAPRSRLYHAVYEMSLAQLGVNARAIELLVRLAAESQADAKGQAAS